MREMSHGFRLLFSLEEGKWCLCAAVLCQHCTPPFSLLQTLEYLRQLCSPEGTLTICPKLAPDFLECAINVFLKMHIRRGTKYLNVSKSEGNITEYVQVGHEKTLFERQSWD